MLDQNHFVTEVTERELKALRIILCTQFQQLTEGTPSIGLISRGFVYLKQQFVTTSQTILSYCHPLPMYGFLP